jgi:hypothetical protein
MVDVSVVSNDFLDDWRPDDRFRRRRWWRGFRGRLARRFGFRFGRRSLLATTPDDDFLLFIVSLRGRRRASRPTHDPFLFFPGDQVRAALRPLARGRHALFTDGYFLFKVLPPSGRRRTTITEDDLFLVHLTPRRGW